MVQDDDSLQENLDESTNDAGAENETPDNFFIDILTGAKESISPKKLLTQRVLKQLIESYGFDRTDLETNFNPRISGMGRRRIDIAIFRPNSPHTSENLQRIILCKTQRKSDKLRSLQEAETDLLEMKELLESIPTTTLGLWTNGQDQFYFQVERSRFEVRLRPLGAWPVPGEGTSDVERTGGVIQVGAEAQDLEDALLRCHKYLNRNLGLDHKDCFKQLAILLMAKIYDETQTTADRNFWIRGDEPFTSQGQVEIQKRITKCIQSALMVHGGLFSRGWQLSLEPHETSRIVMELARYSLSDTQPRYRTGALRAIVRSVMDGREGRYPTPLNVAEMAVQMLDPKPSDRLLDCSCGTGTFLAMAADHVFKKVLRDFKTTPEEASQDQAQRALALTQEWASKNVFGCEIDPFLAVASRINLLFTIGHPGQIFRLDARTFPEGDLDGVASAISAIPLESADVVLLNPWFSTQSPVTDASILQRYSLGHVWERDADSTYRNLGALDSGGIPPEVLFLERAIQWVKAGTGRIGILLPDGLLGNPAQEYVRWWILRHCEVMASVDLPIEPFKVTVKEYGLTPALPSFLVLRRRSREELMQTSHPDYKVFMAVVDRAGVDARGNALFQRAPDGEELIFSDTITERIRDRGEITTRKIISRTRRIDDELPIVSNKFMEFLATGEVTI